MSFREEERVSPKVPTVPMQRLQVTCFSSVPCPQASSAEKLWNQLLKAIQRRHQERRKQTKYPWILLKYKFRQWCKKGLKENQHFSPMQGNEHREHVHSCGNHLLYPCFYLCHGHSCAFNLGFPEPLTWAQSKVKLTMGYLLKCLRVTKYIHLMKKGGGRKKEREGLGGRGRERKRKRERERGRGERERIFCCSVLDSLAEHLLQLSLRPSA